MKSTLAEPEIVTRKGKPVSVIIPIKDYEELLERAEDAEDVAWLKKALRRGRSIARLKITLPSAIGSDDVSPVA
jgi:PHD/YefM family antitoxin component YafN of YafNO toxin-antitoxin module